MDSRRILIIGLFILTLLIGGAAIYIGIQLQNQPDVTPTDTLAVGPGNDINVCGDSNAGDLSANWGEHNANPSCDGCTQNSGCFGPSVWVYRCEAGEEFSAYECRANGQSMGGGVNFASVFTDPCQMVQVDIFQGGPGEAPLDFVVWRGNQFGSSSCNPTPPPTTVPPTTVPPTTVPPTTVPPTTIPPTSTPTPTPSPSPTPTTTTTIVNTPTPTPSPSPTPTSVITETSVEKLVTQSCNQDGTGSTLAYSITVINPNDSILTVTVVDTLDDLITDSMVIQTSITFGGVISNGVITWTDVDVPASGSLTLNYEVLATPDLYEQTVNNTVEVYEEGEVVATDTAQITPFCIPGTALISDEADRVLIAIALIVAGLAMYQFGIHYKIGAFLKTYTDRPREKSYEEKALDQLEDTI